MEAIDVPEKDLALLYQDHTECVNAFRSATFTWAGYPTARDMSTLWTAMQMDGSRGRHGSLEGSEPRGVHIGGVGRVRDGAPRADEPPSRYGELAHDA